jgi:DNA polymerase-4
MAVAGDPASRHGIILAKNELAKAAGVKTAETIWQARKKCPGLVLAPPRHSRYREYSKRVNAIYEEYTDLVEPFGIDESWLDVTHVGHLFGDGVHIADTLRRRVREEVGLTVSVGVSFNKVFAKLGSDYKKPDATTVITEENYKALLYPLPVDALLYVGAATATALALLGVHTIGDLAAADRALMARKFGKMGETIHDYANGLDQGPVCASGDGIKSVGNGVTFRQDLRGWDQVQTAVAYLSEEVAYRMRRCGVKCRTLSVSVKTPDFKTVSRQKTLEAPTNLTKEVRDAALGILRQSWGARTPIRTMTITGSSLLDAQDAPEQLSLFDDRSAHDKLERIEAAADQLRERFGREVIRLGAGKAEGMEVL